MTGLKVVNEEVGERPYILLYSFYIKALKISLRTVRYSDRPFVEVRWQETQRIAPSSDRHNAFYFIISVFIIH